MAKSTRLVLLGCLFIMAMLPVIICKAPPSGKIDSNGNAAETTNNQWQKMADSCVSKLDSAWNVMSPEKVQKLIETLIDARKHKPNLSLDQLSRGWYSLMLLWQDSVRCASDFTTSVSSAIFFDENKYNKQQKDFALHSLRNYLEKCGHEDNFRKATERNGPGRHWDTDKFPTLASYLLRREFLISPEWKDGHGKGFRLAVNLVLSAFKILSEFKDIINEAGCKEKEPRDNLVGLLASKNDSPDVYELVKDYLVLYLHKCGFEERFEKAMIQHNIAIDESNSPLASYLWGEYSRKHIEKYRKREEDKIMFALDVLDYLRYLDGGEEFDCERDTTSDIYKLRERSKFEEIDRFVKCLDDVFPEYLEACANDFKVRAQKFAHDHNETLAFIAKFTKLVEAELRAKYENKQPTWKELEFCIDAVLDDIESGKTDVAEISSETVNFRKEVFYNCKVLWPHMINPLDAMTYNFTPVTVDSGFREFMNYLNVCHFWNDAWLNISPGMRPMLSKLTPYFLVKEPTFQPGECRKWN